MNKQEIINTLENNIKDLTIVLDELKKDTKYSKKKRDKHKSNEILDKAEEETIKSIKNILMINQLPYDDLFIQDVYKVCYKNNIYLDLLESVLQNVRRADNKSPKDDIKKYIFTCLYNAHKK